MTSVEPVWGFNWILGGFYFDEDQTEDNLIYIQEFLPNPFGDDPPVIDGLVDPVSDPTTSTSLAAFLNLTRPIGQKWEVVLGARYTDDEKTQQGTNTLTAIIPDTAALPLNMNVIDNKAEWTQFDWKVGLNWRPTDASLYYASVATGYKMGLFNTDGSEVDPEEVLSFEVGAKSRLFDDTLQLNAALFYMDYENLQRQSVEIDSAGNIGAFTRNATEATNWGAELEGIWWPIAPFRLNLAIAYLNTEFDDYLFTTQDPPIVGPVTSAQLKGNQLPYAPEWTVNLGAQYTWEFATFGSLTPRLNFYWEDESFLGDQNLVPEQFQDSFTQTDARLTWDSPEGHFRVEAFVRNIEDEDVKRNGFNIPPSGWKYIYAAPRTYGARLTVRFP